MLRSDQLELKRPYNNASPAPPSSRPPPPSPLKKVRLTTRLRRPPTLTHLSGKLFSIHSVFRPNGVVWSIVEVKLNCCVNTWETSSTDIVHSCGKCQLQSKATVETTKRFVEFPVVIFKFERTQAFVENCLSLFNVDW